MTIANLQCSQKVSFRPKQVQNFPKMRKILKFFGPVYPYKSFWPALIGIKIQSGRKKLLTGNIEPCSGGCNLFI